MRRREFIALIGTAALSFPRPGRAETKTDLPLVAALFPGSAEMLKGSIPALRLGMQEAGLIEGIHYTLAIRFADGDLRRVPSIAKELDALKPAVMVVAALPATVHKILPEIPMVFTAFAADPIALGPPGSAGSLSCGSPVASLNGPLTTC